MCDRLATADANSRTDDRRVAKPDGRFRSGKPGGLNRSDLVGRIVFDHEFDIWVMNAEGTDRQQITDDPSEDFDAAWSPDGSMIAFRSHRDENEEVYVVGADGAGERNLTDHPRSDYSPAWSPDGSMIAFATDRDADSGGNDIYVVRVDGANPQRASPAAAGSTNIRLGRRTGRKSRTPAAAAGSYPKAWPTSRSA
jgi:Tol biopolymer transport system component